MNLITEFLRPDEPLPVLLIQGLAFRLDPLAQSIDSLTAGRLRGLGREGSGQGGCCSGS